MKYRVRLWILSWLVLCFILCSIIWTIHKSITWICNCYYDSLSCVIVTGNRYFTLDDDICSLIEQLDILGSFVTQDVNVIQKQIERLPWIKQVSVRKQWPDILKIHVVEYVPMAYWNDESIISTTGVVFRYPSRFKSKCNTDIMPILYGPIGKEQEVLNNYLIFNEMFKKFNSVQLESITMNLCHAWQLVLRDGTKLRLGRNNLIEKLCYFLMVYPVLLQKIDDQNKKYIIDYVDLRYKSGFSVRWIHRSSKIVLCNKQVM